MAFSSYKNALNNFLVCFFIADNVNLEAQNTG